MPPPSKNTSSNSTAPRATTNPLVNDPNKLNQAKKSAERRNRYFSGKIEELLRKTKKPSKFWT